MINILLKHTLLTAAIYVASGILFLLLVVVLVHITGAVGILLRRFSLGILFGVMWLLSFNLAWRILRIGQ